MDIKVKDLNQQLFEFKLEQNFRDEDFYVSQSNKHIFEFLNKWPKWEKNFLNISGENCSGKTHLMNIFIKKFNGIKFEASLLKSENLDQIKNQKNVILENLDNNVDEKLVYSLINFIEQDKKFLIITSKLPIVDIKFKLDDLMSRSKNFLLFNIQQPDDELMFALILKNFSDRQISIDKKLINYIIKRIDRSYSKILHFIYKIDEMSLKKKKSINLEIIKDVLGE